MNEPIRNPAPLAVNYEPVITAPGAATTPPPEPDPPPAPVAPPQPDQSAAQAESFRRQVANEKLESTIAFGLIGKELVGSTDAAKAATARALAGELRPRLEAATASDGTVVVREKGTGRPAADVIREFLASPDTQHFIAARNVGGANPHAGGLPTGGDVRPMTWLERNAAMVNQRRASDGSFGLVNR